MCARNEYQNKFCYMQYKLVFFNCYSKTNMILCMTLVIHNWSLVKTVTMQRWNCQPFMVASTCHQIREYDDTLLIFTFFQDKKVIVTTKSRTVAISYCRKRAVNVKIEIFFTYTLIYYIKVILSLF